MTALSVRQRRNRGGARRSKWLTIALFLVPALALYVVFVLFPIVQATHYSLYKCNVLQQLTDFIGLKNYQVDQSSDAFRGAIGNNLLIFFLSLTIQIPFSLALAVMLNRRFRGRAIFRLLFFLPYVLSEAVTGIIFRLLLQPHAFVDSGLASAGLGSIVQDWLGDANIIMLTMFVIISWKYFGFHMIL